MTPNSDVRKVINHPMLCHRDSWVDGAPSSETVHVEVGRLIVVLACKIPTGGCQQTAVTTFLTDQGQVMWTWAVFVNERTVPL